MSRVLIRNVACWWCRRTGECRVDEAQAIQVDNGRIIAITPTRATPHELAAAGDTAAPEQSSALMCLRHLAGRGPGGGEVIDGAGLLAVAWVVNSHTHSPMVMMRGAAEDVSIDDWFNQRIWPMEVNVTPERVRVGARLACAEMLLAGVTTFVDHYFHADQIAAAAVESGIRADLAPTYFSSPAPKAIDGAIATARTCAPSTPRITASLGPHATYTVSDDDLRRTADIAQAEGFRIHLHAAETDDQNRSSLDKYGVTPMQVLETHRRTGGRRTDRARGRHPRVRPAHPRAVRRSHTRWPVARRCTSSSRWGRSPRSRVSSRSGVRVGVGTDGAAVHNTLDVWSRSAWSPSPRSNANTTPSGMTLSDTLRLATQGGAAAAGLADRIGVWSPPPGDIRPHRLSGPHNPAAPRPRAAWSNSVRPSDVVTVLRRRKVVVRDRQLTTMSLTDVLATPGPWPTPS
jgi:5-methylthioadenosine/S-adenosylhomocysteine deaminase